MGLRIKQLPPAVANQIAAGEVIERPASVVKELLENAFDAGASIIHIEVIHGGLNHIRISDNGSGILAEDLSLAVTAHATSKISQLDDLYLLDSMGFRGEALASIAAISKLTITSKHQTEEQATCLEVYGSELKLSPAARNIGTTVDVIDLFFNAPVRKKFLKTEKQEFIAIETVVKRFALSASQIAIQLKHNGKVLLSLPKAESNQANLNRIAKIFGQTFVKNACFFEADQKAMRLSGWIGGIGCQRSQNDKQWIYINQRMVKDKLLFHAIKQAYEGILHPGRFPSCLLYFTLDTREVDVNVHPTKHEVRFQNPRLVHDFFIRHVGQALKNMPLTPHIIQKCKSIGESWKLNEPSPIFHPGNVSWIILNSQYGLLFKTGKPCLIDMKALYHVYLLRILRKMTLPLASRPLLVPLRCFLPDINLKRIEDLQKALQPFSIFLNLDDGFLKVLSIPLVLPQLDLRGLVDYLYAKGLLEQTAIIECLCKYQFFDAAQLSNEEKNELSLVLEDIDVVQPFYKELTVDDCRKWLESFV